MFKYFFLIGVTCITFMVLVCCRSIVPESFSSEKRIGNSTVRQYVSLSLDPTITKVQQNIHTERLIRWLYHSEFSEVVDETEFTLNALGETLQNLYLYRYADNEHEFTYYNEYRIKPSFVNKKLSIYEVVRDSNHEYHSVNKMIKYYFIEKHSNTPLYLVDLFNSTYKDFCGLSELLKKYLLLNEKSASVIEEIMEKDENDYIPKYLYVLSDFSFDEDSMICLFNDKVLDSSLGTITLRIPIEEAKPFLSDTLKELLF